LPIEPGRSNALYLRAAQAYMLISMPTGTSTILGVFQVIPFSQAVWRELHAEFEPRTTPDIAQVRKIERRTPPGQACKPIFLSWTQRFLSWTRSSGDRSIGVPNPIYRAFGDKTRR